jgi:putative DNA primase/helicase
MYAQPISRIVARPIDWLSFGRLAQGKLTLFDGDPGLGKSWVALDICARFSTGRPWPDAPPAVAQASSLVPGDADNADLPDTSKRGRLLYVNQPVNTLVFSAEDHDDDTVKPRLHALGADPERAFVWPWNRPWPRLPRDFDVLKQEITDTQAKLVVLDPLAAFLEFDSVLTNDGARGLMERLGRLAEELRCAMLLMRHLGKCVQGSALYRGLGPMAFMGVCRLPWFVARDPHRPDVSILASPKNNLAPDQPALAYRIAADPAAPRVEWLGASPYTADALTQRRAGAADRRRALARRFVTRYLHKHGPSLMQNVWHAARRYRYSLRTLQRARIEAGAVVERVPGKGRVLTFWRMSDQQLPAHLRPPERHDLDPWLEKLS